MLVFAITPNNPSFVSGGASTWSITPALPTGLSLNPVTGVITGTPTVPTATANYTVTASNTNGSTNKVISITVPLQAPTSITYAAQAPTYTVGTAITSNTVTVVGLVDTFTVSPSLPAGLALDGITGTISGTPSDTASLKDYVVTGANDSGFTLDTVAIQVRPAIPTSVTYAPDTTTYYTGIAISNTPVVLATGPVVVDSFRSNVRYLTYRTHAKQTHRCYFGNTDSGFCRDEHHCNWYNASGTRTRCFVGPLRAPLRYSYLKEPWFMMLESPRISLRSCPLRPALSPVGP